ncbi:MAG: hypothetical protein H7Z72_23520 [Bacteroidetes bacterium]|nr:hypothetical protein [Fibrella sp.]
MLSHEKSTDLLDSTMAILQADVSTLTPQTGKGLLDEWITAIEPSESATNVVDLLETLKTQLESGPELRVTGEILQKLAVQTQEMGTTLGAEGDMSTRLEALSLALRTFGGQLGNV